MIRPMQECDIEAVFAIEQAVYSFPWSKQNFYDCLQVGYWCSVLEVEQQVIGYIICLIVLDEVHILNIAVSSKMQRQGHGQHLLSYVLQQAVIKDISKVFLEVRKSNIAAIELYIKFGFNEIATRKDYYLTENGREDAAIMLVVLKL